MRRKYVSGNERYRNQRKGESEWGGQGGRGSRRTWKALINAIHSYQSIIYRVIASRNLCIFLCIENVDLATKSNLYLDVFHVKTSDHISLKEVRDLLWWLSSPMTIMLYSAITLNRVWPRLCTSTNVSKSPFISLKMLAYTLNIINTCT